MLLLLCVLETVIHYREMAFNAQLDLEGNTLFRGMRAHTRVELLLNGK